MPVTLDLRCTERQGERTWSTSVAFSAEDMPQVEDYSDKFSAFGRARGRQR